MERHLGRGMNILAKTKHSKSTHISFSFRNKVTDTRLSRENTNGPTFAPHSPESYF
jgi:hypothetical protein